MGMCCRLWERGWGCSSQLPWHPKPQGLHCLPRTLSTAVHLGCLCLVTVCLASLPHSGTLPWLRLSTASLLLTPRIPSVLTGPVGFPCWPFVLPEMLSSLGFRKLLSLVVQVASTQPR